MIICFFIILFHTISCYSLDIQFIGHWGACLDPCPLFCKTKNGYDVRFRKNLGVYLNLISLYTAQVLYAHIVNGYFGLIYVNEGGPIDASLLILKLLATP